MKKSIIWIVAVIAVIIAVFSHYYRYGWNPKGGTNAAMGKTDGTAALEQKVTSFSIDGRSPKGVKQWHLDGKSAVIKDDQIHLNDLTAVAYGDDTTINLRSDKGIYKRDKGAVELIGNVEVVSDDGLLLTTERAIWSQVTREISTDTLVNIKQDGMIAEGTGGMANAEGKTAMLKKDITVDMEPATTVKCKGPLEVDYNGNIAIFYDTVMVEDKDGRLFADKLIVNFDPETQKIAQVLAEGNVKVKRGNSYTISDKAIYTESTKSAQLLGRPRVIIDPGELGELDAFGMSEKAEK